MNREEELMLSLKLKKLKALEEETKEADLLPHLYMHKNYQWGREFEDDLTTRTQVVCAANQIGKTSTLLKKLFRIATSPELWPKMWPDLPEGMKPAQWWYLYPSSEMANIELEEKWKPLLPKFGEDHPRYGWRVRKIDQRLSGISFNSGINIYFKYYSQNVINLQGASCYLMGIDEEAPIAVIPELQMRVRATNGYMFFVFTPTIGQTFWKQVVEDRIVWPSARVWQPSLLDCMKYDDGSDSHWSPERVEQAIQDCVSENEKQRRIYARVLAENDSGRQFPTFKREFHVKQSKPMPDGWSCIVGIDYGSGVAPRGHPSAITFLAVNEERTAALVFRHWRGDNLETTAEDVVNQYEHMAIGVPVQIVFYDYSQRDIGIIAQRRGLPFQLANKARDSGKIFINSLFKAGALHIAEWSSFAEVSGVNPTHLQTEKMMIELEALREDEPKTHAKDDSVDSLRYPISGIAWAWEAINAKREEEHVERRGGLTRVEPDPRVQWLEDFKRGESPIFGVDEELEFWRDQFEID